MWSTPLDTAVLALGLPLEVDEVAHPQVPAGRGAAEQDGGVVGRGDGGQVGLARDRGGAAAAPRPGPRRGRRRRPGRRSPRPGPTPVRRRPAWPSPWLSSTRASPWRHWCTGLDRCGPTCAKPMASSTSAARSPEAGPTASSAKAKRSARGAGGTVAAPTCSPSASSERRASTAMRLGLGLAEVVVEDLQRPRPVVARGLHVAHEGGQVEAALAREAAVVAAPLEHVHAQHRRVGQLQEEDLVAGDALDLGRVAAAREDVERVQAGAQRGMVGALHDRPGVAVVADVPPPGQRLEGDPHAVLLRLLGQRGAAGPPTARGRRWRPAPRWSRPGWCPRPARP